MEQSRERQIEKPKSLDDEFNRIDQEFREKTTNVGEQPELGLSKAGSRERKARCEDVKVNDPDKGLFLVADGVSSNAGWLASRELGISVQEEVGQKLDDQIKAIGNNDRLSPEQKILYIDKLAEAQLKKSLTEADRKIKTSADRLKESGLIRADSATTASVGKLVELPNGTQRFYITNVGDSRIYVMRGKEILQITADDSFVTEALRKGNISKEDAKLVDQAVGIDEVPDDLRMYYNYRNIITKSVGAQEGASDANVQKFDVMPGDRLILTSDGIHDQMLEDDIKKIMFQNGSDRTAEKALQEAALNISMGGKDNNKRSKGDDIAAIVYNVKERGPNMMRSHENDNEPETTQYSESDIQQWEKSYKQIESMIIDMKLAGAESVEEQIKLNQLEGKLSNHDYWISRATSEIISSELPIRYKEGDSVKVEGSSSDWKISHYIPQNESYAVSLDVPNDDRSLFKQVDRIKLEEMQSDTLVKLDDILPIKTRSGKEMKMTVATIEDGLVTLISWDESVGYSESLPVDVVNKIYKNRIQDKKNAESRQKEALKMFKKTEKKKALLIKKQEQDARTAAIKSSN